MLRARSMMAAVMATSSASSGRLRTNARSILSLSIGKRFRFTSDECPVPKSSMASFTPSALSPCSWRAISAVSSISMLSVSSKARYWGSRPVSSSTLATSVIRFFWRNCTAARLTATGTRGSPASCQALFWRHACRSTHEPMVRISPRCSATGMKSLGGMKLPSFCGQRISASTPVTAPVSTRICGWKCSRKSSSRIASRKRVSSVSARWAASDRLSLKNWKLLRPRPFARYMAASAFLMSASADTPSRGKTLMPIDGLTEMLWPSSSIGSLIAASSFSATGPAASPSSSSGSTTRNSSPPWRDTTSTPRNALGMRPAMIFSSASPATWPSESLTALKLSRSMKSTAACVQRRFAVASTNSSRSCSSARFGRPVSRSWCARKSMRASDALRRRMSRTMDSR